MGPFNLVNFYILFQIIFYDFYVVKTPLHSAK